jgi:hypothetical protein
VFIHFAYYSCCWAQYVDENITFASVAAVKTLVNLPK